MKEDERFQRAFEDAAIGISLVAVEPFGQYLEVNPAFCRMTGYSREELLARDFQSITASQDLNKNLERVRTLLSGTVHSLQIEKRYIRKDGSSFWARLHASLTRDKKDKPLYIIVQIEDIDERIWAEEALRESEERYRTLVETASDAIITIDEESRILSVNSATEKIFGYSSIEMLGQPLTMLMPESLRQTHLAAVKRYTIIGERHVSWESKGRQGLHKSGKEIPLEISYGHFVQGGRHFFSGIVRDITKRKQLEEQLRHAQKLEAIGQLAGGVAHEFNNILTALIGNLSVAIKQTDEKSDLRSALIHAEQAAHRAAMLTQQLLTFSRRSPVDLQPRNLNLIVEEAVRLLRQTIDRRIQVAVEPTQGLWPVLVDGDQMHQVVMNLCVNARDALMERLAKDAGQNWQPLIAIKTDNIQMDEAYCRFRSDTKIGDYVCLSISDNGCGMDEAIQHRLFEPFFTTKEVGRGTGLGLATVHGIVKQHEGWIELTSAKNEGTTFQIYLPRTQQLAVPMPPKTVEEAVAGGTETILFVDDEASIRRLGQTVLEHHGYTVLLAKDGVEALEIFRHEHERIRLVVLDLTMPRQSGAEVLRQLLLLNPKVKVIVSSGHHKTPDINEFQDLGSLAFVPKPYRPHELARAVRRVLDQPDPPD